MFAQFPDTLHSVLKCEFRKACEAYAKQFLSSKQSCNGFTA